MTAKHFREMSEQAKHDYSIACARQDNAAAAIELNAFEKYLDKTIEVTKGRKVPIGTTGKVFWIGLCNHEKHQPWWSWSVRIGFKDDHGNTFFTAEENIALCR